MINNKKAYYNYNIEEEYEAGMMLQGSEVKSLRQGKATINEAYIADIGGEIFLTNCHISEYKGANRFNHEPTRNRKLLLKSREIKKILGQMKVKGYALVPIKIYFNKKNVAKILIGLGKGKKLHDKRETIKRRDETRRLQRGEE
ncbi:MAG: SsrA-binding protein SmpB [Rickettsiales bacterium]|nr:SsrA-binding protein SmpB [Rickettsiales bacterium]